MISKENDIIWARDKFVEDLITELHRLGKKNRTSFNSYPILIFLMLVEHT